MTDPDISPDRPAVKAEPVVTGVGKYWTQRDGVIEIKHWDGNYWFDRGMGDGGHAWKSDGTAVNTLILKKLSDIVARVGNPTEAAKKEFRITGPGRYKDDKGMAIEVIELVGGAGGEWHTSKGYHYSDGRWNTDVNAYRIVAGPFPDEPAPQTDAKELAGLSGFIGISRNGSEPTQHTEYWVVSHYGTVIDLSKVPASAIVQPKPEPLRVKKFVNFYSNGVTGAHASKEMADAHGSSTRIACIPVEFTEGEGL